LVLGRRPRAGLRQHHPRLDELEAGRDDGQDADAEHEPAIGREDVDGWLTSIGRRRRDDRVDARAERASDRRR
jgi:hypothetical protein